MKEDMTYPNFMWKEGGAGTTVTCYMNDKHIVQHTFKTKVTKDYIKQFLDNIHKDLNK